MEAARKRLEALLAQLERTTATAEHTITEVRQALQELDDQRQRNASRSVKRAGSRRPAKTRAPRQS